WATHELYNAISPTGPEPTAYSWGLANYLAAPELPLNRSLSPWSTSPKPQYGAFVLASYLADRTSFNFVRQTWQAMSGKLPIEAIAQVLTTYGRNLTTELQGYAVANYRLAAPTSGLTGFLGASDGYMDSSASSVWRGQLPGERPSISSSQTLTWGGAEKTDHHTLYPGGSTYTEFSPPTTGLGQLTIRVRAPQLLPTAKLHYFLVTWDNLTSRTPQRWARADVSGKPGEVGDANGTEYELSVPIKAGQTATLIATRSDVLPDGNLYGANGQMIVWRAQMVVNAESNTALNAMWARHANRTGYETMCDDWGGGDGTQSVKLPSGNRAWFFSDTYLGASNFRPTFDRSMVHNSIVVQDGEDPASASLRTITGGNTCKERDTSIPIADRYAWTPVRSNTSGPDTGNEYYWSGTGKVVGNNVVWFYLKGAGYTFKNTSMAVIPINQLESSSAINIVPQDLPPYSYYGTDNPLVWGDAVVDDSDGHTYIYGWGVVDASFNKKPFLARVAQGNLTNFNSWRFYVGGGNWSADGGASGQAKAVPLATGHTDAMYSVITLNGRHWIVSLDPKTHQVVAYPSTTRYGFTAARVKLYTLPDSIQTAPDFKIVYDLHLHQDLIAKLGTVVISYNVNSTGVTLGCRAENDYEPSIYRARFVNLAKTAFDPSAATTTVAPSTTTGSLPAISSLSGDRREMRGLKYSPFPSKFAKDGIPTTQQHTNRALSAQNGLLEDRGYYNSLSYQSAADKANNHVGCPYIAAPKTLTGQITIPAWGWVELNWDHVGLDVGYNVFERNVTENARRHWPWGWTFGPPRVIAPLDDYPGDRNDEYEWYLEPVNIWNMQEKTRSPNFRLRMPS
ncbi:hypothetical protein, partial [Nonomuraea sp. LPB2021202275-12-8]|uniref:hypothetical protein n=1 Tax=Nonomuraea sp. LPB2021202275-12-8 TaxID=3120159 RepID=UPI00300C9801